MLFIINIGTVRPGCRAVVLKSLAEYPSAIPDSPLPGSTASTPFCASTDVSLRHRWWDGTGWFPNPHWEDLGGGLNSRRQQPFPGAQAELMSSSVAAITIFITNIGTAPLAAQRRALKILAAPPSALRRFPPGAQAVSMASIVAPTMPGWHVVFFGWHLVYVARRVSAVS